MFLEKHHLPLQLSRVAPTIIPFTECEIPSPCRDYQVHQVSTPGWNPVHLDNTAAIVQEQPDPARMGIHIPHTYLSGTVVGPILSDQHFAFFYQGLLENRIQAISNE